METALAAGKYLTWGVISVSVANLVVVLVMIVAFLLAIVLPFPAGPRRAATEENASSQEREP